MKISIITICFGLMLVSCTNEKNIFEKCINEEIPYLNLDKIKYVVVIPSQGCGGCITYTETYYKNNKGKEGVYYIFTNIISEKILRQKIGDDGSNVYFDRKNKFTLAYPSDKKLYPAVLKISQGKVSEIFYQSPDENGLAKISDN